MKEWNNNELEKVDNKQLSESNVFDNALVVISNLIARATTKWTVEETKLFLCAVTKIKSRNEDNWVTLPKIDIQEKLGITQQNGTWLRETFKKVVQKSYIQLNGQSADEWHDGFLLYEIKSTKKTISIKFNDTYIPLLDQLSSHFTEFYLDYVKDFKRLSSFNLYVFLSSWHDPDYLIQNKKIAKNELPKIFNLKDSDYWRHYGTEKAKFDWSDFEKRVLKPAIEEINNLSSCDMHIDSCEKVKKGKTVLGYDIKYSFVDENGYRK